MEARTFCARCNTADFVRRSRVVMGEEKYDEFHCARCDATWRDRRVSVADRIAGRNVIGAARSAARRRCSHFAARPIRVRFVATMRTTCRDVVVQRVYGWRRFRLNTVPHAAHRQNVSAVITFASVPSAREPHSGHALGRSAASGRSPDCDRK